MTGGEVRRDDAAGRYVLDVDGETAFAAFVRDGDAVVFTHTIVPPDEQGHGVGSRLIAGALADVRRQGLRVVPQCPFVAAYLERHPDAADIA